MCGRYTMHLSPARLAETLDCPLPEEYAPDYNISPGRDILSLTENTATMMHWGHRTPHNFHINARLETADAAPRFRDAWMEHRCLIPANGFYEWLNDGVRKQPYYFKAPDENLLYFAGLWFTPAAPEQLPQCVLLTINASESVRPVHSRMPVALPQELINDWLKRKLSKNQVIHHAADQEYLAQTVSSRVNNPKNNDYSLIEPVLPSLDEEMQLF